MQFIPRQITQAFLEHLRPGKVLVLLGPRRVGKTVFIEHLLENHITEAFIQLNGEDLATQAVLQQRTLANYRRLVSGHSMLVIDEAQKVPDIGLVLKLMVDNIPGLKIIATGSSVFDLTNKLGEPLTGRKTTFYLFPLAQSEYTAFENLAETKARLPERLIFGNYPELLQYPTDNQKAGYLNELVNGALLKDILAFEGIRNASKVIGLLRLIAFQMGKEVSLEELGKNLQLSRNTVEKYLDLLGKTFVVFKLPGFSRNLRSEVTKSSRWYFYDNGIRNAIISNFNPLILRDDTGALWENYFVTERLKYQHYTGKMINNHFWRTYQQQEIDWVEEEGGKLRAFEIKWNPTKKVRVPSAWLQAYPNSQFQVITPENYLDWILP
jgi:predicted AAA+ superfamily ATPase